MKNIKKIVLLTLLLIVILNLLVPLKREKHCGVVITFDDYSVNEWCWADSILRKFNWKATFNISNLNKFSEEDYRKLQILVLPRI
jgi:peptidoglycan/xylan/chitin deacetylase (PgdA/CDA1 family)